MRSHLALVGSLALLSAGARADEPVPLRPDGVETDCVAAVTARAPVAASPTHLPSTLPTGRAIAALEPEPCLTILREAGVVFEARPEAEGVGIPILLRGTLGGVALESRNHVELHEIMDCRLAVAVLAWAPALRAAGVRRLLHYSVFRPSARVATTGRPSGHAGGLAIDLAVLETDDGTAHDVLTAWEARERGAPPCEGEHEEAATSAALRRLVCEAARSELFQIVLTPHFDRAHQNHLHLELRPGVPWQYVR